MTYTAQQEGQARRALEKYDIQASQLTLLGTSDNTVYRVTTEEGEAFALRLHDAPRHTNRVLTAEMVWLEYLSRVEPELAPHPVPSKTGDWVVPIHEGQGPEATATLLTWVEGQTLDALDLAQAEQAGALLARLHRHAETFRPPADFERPTYDLAHYQRRWRELRELLEPDNLTAEQAAVVESSWPTFSALISSPSSVPGGFGLVHGDAHQGNFVVRDGELRVIDFGRLGWAPLLLDVADCTLDTELPERAAFLDGYRRLRQLPPDYERHFRALMYLSVLDNLAFLARYPHEVEGVMETLGQVLEAIAGFTTIGRAES